MIISDDLVNIIKTQQLNKSTLTDLDHASYVLMQKVI